MKSDAKLSFLFIQRARKLEADRIRKEEEAALRKQLGKKEAKAEAERRLQHRYREIEEAAIIEEKQEREEAKKKREQAEKLESQKGKEVSDTELMNKMFDFLEDENGSSDGRTTDAFGESQIFLSDLC